MARISNTEITEKAVGIFETLTTSYYTGNGKVGAKLDPKAQTSFFDMESRQITVSLQNVVKATRAKIDANGGKLSTLAIEEAIREELYHELSHAILTPINALKDFGTYSWRLYKDGKPLNELMTADDFNVYEDERIETIFANYYMRTDFKASIKSLCPYREPTNFEEFRFFATRHRRSPYKQAECSALVDSFVESTKGINSCNGKESELFDKAQKLHDALRAIYAEYMADKEAGNQGNQGKEGQEGENGNQGQNGGRADSQNGESTENRENPENGESTEKGEKGQTPADAKTAEKGEDAVEPTAKEAREIAGRALCAMESAAERFDNSHGIKSCKMDNRAYVEILKIITRSLGVGHARQPIAYGFSGKLSARRIVKDANDEMKWWRKRSFCDGMKADKGKKKTLNVWLDQSGSFRSHDRTINGILRALVELEEKRDDFEWNLIRMDEHCKVETRKGMRLSQSSGGNCLPESEFDKAYKETHKGSDTFDIVLFDGSTACSIEDMKRWCSTEEEYNRQHEDLKRQNLLFDPLARFNNKRAVFITEGSNAVGIREVCPNCRAIIEENSDYEGKLLENVVRGLGVLF